MPFYMKCCGLQFCIYYCIAMLFEQAVENGQLIYYYNR